nr:uncharacterized protein LOC109158777 [Ipomoea trifida]
MDVLMKYVLVKVVAVLYHLWKSRNGVMWEVVLPPAAAKGVSTASNKATFGATLFTPSCAFSIAKNGVLPDVRIPCWRESLACKEALS